ncbi:MAG: Rrf2 family transcriptional regulator [Planctomycetota bacterium]
MFLSHKCQYAVRSIFELGKHYGNGPVKIADIARAQGIPARFLEVILSELKQGGFVESKRGAEGGYFLGRDPGGITVGEVIRFVEGPLGPVGCLGDAAPRERCPLHENCVFTGLWGRAREAVSAVYDTTSFRDLAEEEAQMGRKFTPNYVI